MVVVATFIAIAVVVESHKAKFQVTSSVANKMNKTITVHTERYVYASM